MKKLFMAVIALMMTIGASAQFYIYFSDGTVAKVDSISMIAPHESVDLGLSVKWATCNIGANKPEEFGDYFAWGEVEPKEEYNWTTYKWCNGSRLTLTKYCSNGGWGIVDNKTVLDKSDDAAAVKWGGDWRIPTQEEVDELCENCTWFWTSINGVVGYQVTGKNGNSIFLPAAGRRLDFDYDYVGEEGRYWSNIFKIGYPEHGSGLYFYNGDYRTLDDGRCQGLPIRPVCP